MPRLQSQSNMISYSSCHECGCRYNKVLTCAFFCNFCNLGNQTFENNIFLNDFKSSNFYRGPACRNVAYRSTTSLKVHMIISIIQI